MNLENEQLGYDVEFIEDMRIDCDPRLEVVVAMDSLQNALKAPHAFSKKNIARLEQAFKLVREVDHAG